MTIAQFCDLCPACSRWREFVYENERGKRYLYCLSCGKGYVPTVSLSELIKTARQLEELYRLNQLPQPPGFSEVPHRKLRNQPIIQKRESVSGFSFLKEWMKQPKK